MRQAILDQKHLIGYASPPYLGLLVLNDRQQEQQGKRKPEWSTQADQQVKGSWNYPFQISISVLLLSVCGAIIVSTGRVAVNLFLWIDMTNGSSEPPSA